MYLSLSPALHSLCPLQTLYAVISEGKKDKDIYVPTHLSISIFLSLTRSCGYYAGGNACARTQHLASHHSRCFTDAVVGLICRRRKKEKEQPYKSGVITATASLIVHSDMLATGDAHQHAREAADMQGRHRRSQSFGPPD